MAAYVIVDVTVHDQMETEKYRSLVPATLAASGGKFIVRGGPTTILEGDWNPKRIVVLEFPTVERAKERWNSDYILKLKRSDKELQRQQ